MPGDTRSVPVVVAAAALLGGLGGCDAGAIGGQPEELGSTMSWLSTWTGFPCFVDNSLSYPSAGTMAPTSISIW
jgi:hypothetical protein